MKWSNKSDGHEGIAGILKTRASLMRNHEVSMLESRADEPDAKSGCHRRMKLGERT